MSRRADVLRGPEPRSLGELAERLQHPVSVFEALNSLSVPHLQAIEALLTLDRGACAPQLAELLDPGADPKHEANVDAVLAELSEYALVWSDPDGRLRFAGPLREAFLDPLGLGLPARALLGNLTVAILSTIQKRLGLPRVGNKRATVESIVERLRDAAFVRQRIKELPESAREHLMHLAESTESTESSDDDLFYDVRRYDSQRAAELVLTESGLLIESVWGPHRSLPAEVTRALRGDEFRAPFAPHRPEITWDAVGVEAVENEAGVRAADFAERAASLLDLVAAQPLALVKSGGVGARELARVAKAAGTTETLTRLVIELGGAAGLLDAHGDGAMVTSAYDTWREQEPARRLAPLLSAWWTLPATPTTPRDQDGKAIAALASRPPCESCARGRRTVLAVLASAPDGQGARDTEAITGAAWWTHPTIHLPSASDDEPMFAWTEAETLGVIARGAITSVGRALLSGDDALLDAALDRLLPESTHTAAFGSDLTVVVSGAPSARVRALLDGCADREGRGAATVWRFTPASVRRALDAGVAADDLSHELGDIASTGLPQPLRYLIGDVARRHGHLRVTAATSCVHSPDEALLAEVVAHRKLRPLGLRLLAPTVAVGGSSVRDTISALRAAGYLPLGESSDGVVALERPRNARATPQRRRVPPSRETPSRETPSRETPRPNAQQVAARLLAAPASPGDAASSGTEALVGEFADGLSTAEIRQLAHAIDESLPIRIEYQAATGGYTSRVVSELQIEPPFLVGWCHLRNAERMFTLARIQSATAV